MVPNPALCLILTQTVLFDSNVVPEPTKDVNPGNGVDVVLLLKIRVTSLVGLKECYSRTNKDVELGTHTTSTNQSNLPNNRTAKIMPQSHRHTECTVQRM